MGAACSGVAQFQPFFWMPLPMARRSGCSETRFHCGCFTPCSFLRTIQIIAVPLTALDRIIGLMEAFVEEHSSCNYRPFHGLDTECVSLFIYSRLTTCKWCCLPFTFKDVCIFLGIEIIDKIVGLLLSSPCCASAHGSPRFKAWCAPYTSGITKPNPFSPWIHHNTTHQSRHGKI